GLGQGATAAPKGADPAADEVDLVAGDERRRADVEQDRPICAQADLTAKLVPAPAGPPVEPVVVGGRAGHADTLPRDPLELDGLVGLEVVPDDQLLGQVVDEALVREVVPA